MPIGHTQVCLTPAARAGMQGGGACSSSQLIRQIQKGTVHVMREVSPTIAGVGRPVVTQAVLGTC